MTRSIFLDDYREARPSNNSRFDYESQQDNSSYDYESRQTVGTHCFQTWYI